ncbi:long-chain fatty acid--CoA ligase [Novosphingobium cyanobacteriorum]|uniref:Long-chain fatty acid--CoA ligase n=1 Tax=Novosphingobium cyanobacteriorum TaxID=3024215 RepID=A0ABT6CJ35_9SPHN|nr:long-chain fatty acid--CoA ligase [Novosphingobium cyanobacteriorum]MDF8333911.1 long-chain fatty acid--CoA ligase [Novosphingobium cyanobacteriorum]
MLLGAMQDWPLRVTRLIDHAAREHGGREIVSRWADGSETRTTWAGVRRDAMRMANALRALGIAPGDRIATLAMNHHRHLVTWYGAVGAGGILHTINPRLFDDQLEYIANHAEDKVLLFDRQWAPIVERMKPRWTTIEHYICFDSDEPARAFEDWIAGASDEGEWADGDEREPCMLCYTSGTTGNPKGVLYEHRSTMLHALTALGRPVLDMDCRTVMMPIVPMFHAASWGIPWAGAAAGAKLVYSASNDPATVCELFENEKVTSSAGVPTVWLGVFQHIDRQGKPIPPDLKQIVCGGSAMPRAMIERFMAAGVRIAHAWGMTETSPIGTTGCETPDWDELTFDEQVSIKAMQGRVPFGVEIRCVDLGDPTMVLPRDGKTSGALQVRGPWVVRRYFKAEQDATTEGQWFDTGDVGVIHPDGTLQLTDRTKDVIKSGGEWISSVELENAAIGHPAVAEAAAIGIQHPKWDERPLLVVVKKPEAAVSADDLRTFLGQHVAKWWVPDDVAFVDAIPHTGTGKISKKDLREQFRDWQWKA